MSDINQLYTNAVKEYELENENTKFKLICSYFGFALYQGQCLEKQLENMILLERVNRDFSKIGTLEELDIMIDKVENSKDTLGILIGKVKRVYNLTEDMSSKLEDILIKRNYLAHSYFKHNIGKFYSEKGPLEMLKYFTDFIYDSEKLDDELNFYCENYKKKMGITDNKIAEIVEKIQAEENRAS